MLHMHSTQTKCFRFCIPSSALSNTDRQTQDLLDKFCEANGKTTSSNHDVGGTTTIHVASPDGAETKEEAMAESQPQTTGDCKDSQSVLDQEHDNTQTPPVQKEHQTKPHSPLSPENIQSGKEIVNEAQDIKPIPLVPVRQCNKRRTSLANAITGSILKREPLPRHSTVERELALKDFAAPSEYARWYTKRHKVTANSSAKVGFWKLFWTEFKTWYRRWSLKSQEPVFLKSSIIALESNFGSAIGCMFRFLRTMMFLNLLLAILWLSFVVIPTAVTCPNFDLIGDFSVLNVIDGRGVMAKSFLFYGAYPQTIGSYHVGMAYLTLLLVTYFGSLLYILASTVRGSTIESARWDTRFRYSKLLWTSWDYSVTSENGSRNLSSGITSQIQDYFNESKAKELSHRRTAEEKKRMYYFRALAWFTTVILIGGGCTTIVYLVIITNVGEVIKDSSTEIEYYVLKVYSTAIIFSCINFFVAQCITLLPKMEHYACGKEELYITLSRIICLRMANLYALITTLYKTITQSSVTCAGTVIGQELYKLVIMDTLLHTVALVVVSSIKFVWIGEKQEFNISHTVLVMIYRQALIWAGTLACPVMPLVGLLSHFLSFWALYFVVSKTCKPPIKRWNQSRSSSVFAWFLLITLAILIPPMSVVIANADVVQLGLTDEGDKFCGPFGSGQPTSAYSHFTSQQPSGMRYFLELVISATVILPMFLILLSLLIFQRMKIFTELKRSAIFRAQINYERDQNEILTRTLQVKELRADQ